MSDERKDRKGQERKATPAEVAKIIQTVEQVGAFLRDMVPIYAQAYLDFKAETGDKLVALELTKTLILVQLTPRQDPGKDGDQ